MSAQAVAHVFQNPTESGSSTLVWLALADVANDQNENLLWMSNYGIQCKTRLSEATVRRCLHDLVEWGCIDVVETRDGKSTLYRFQFTDLPQIDTRSAHTTPRQEATRGAQVARGNPPQDDTQTQVSNSSKTQRPKDEIFDALCLVCKINSAEVTKTGRGELNAAVKELKAVGATPREIIRRSVVWKQKYPEILVTPSALKKHWAALEPVDRSVVDIYPGASQKSPVGAETLSPEEKERNQTRVQELSERFRAGLRD